MAHLKIHYEKNKIAINAILYEPIACCINAHSTVKWYGREISKRLKCGTNVACCLCSNGSWKFETYKRGITTIFVNILPSFGNNLEILFLRSFQLNCTNIKLINRKI